MKKELVSHWETFPPTFDFFEKEERIILVNMILLDQVQSIVEFAMGTGIIPIMMRKRGYKGRYVGTDIIDNFLKISKEHNPNEDIRFADLDEPLPFKDKEFEAVVIITGLGYCQEIEKTFRELKRITSKYIYISQFNLFAEKTDLRFLRHHGWGNQYNKQEFDEMLNRVGLTNLFEASITNGKDYIAYDNIESSKVNHIYKLGV